MDKRAVVAVRIPFGSGASPRPPEGPLAADSATKHRYMEALALEMRAALPLLSEYSVAAIYVGGGSPSVMRPDDMAGFLRELREGCNLERGFELSLGVAPQTVGTPCMDGLKGGGVNLARMRVPSAQDAELERAGCRYRRADVENAMLFMGRFGIRETGFEVAYGMPGQDERSLGRTLQLACAYRPELVSLSPWPDGRGAGPTEAEAYAAPADVSCAAELLMRGAFPSMGAAVGRADLLSVGSRYLEEHGYTCYAAWNGTVLFGRDGRRSRYVEARLSGCDVFGLGLGAVSLMGGVLCQNTGDLECYLACSASFDKITARAERLVPERLADYRRMREAAQVGEA